MTDREMLELAAKAFGIAIDRWHEDANGVPVIIYVNDRGGHSFWQPLLENMLTDCMGDALRLAVKLRITPNLDYESGSGYPAVSANLPLKRRWWATNAKLWAVQEYLPADDTESSVTEKDGLVLGIESATRRAIVQAAAYIGEAMP